MIFIPPYTLTGEAGKALGAVGYSLAALGVLDAVLNLRSLDADTLTFSLRDNGSRPAIPDDGQWLTLTDSAGQVLFTGIAKRSFRFPARIYSYEVANVYRGLLETPLLATNGRPYQAYDAGDLKTRLHSILTRANTSGLPIQPPDINAMPTMFMVPKCAYRSFSLAGAFEDSLKWAPDTVSRMDYTTTPPTLRVLTRGQETAKVLDLTTGNQKATAIELTPYPEGRALSISFMYAQRDGAQGVIYRVQQYGNIAAEARRVVSIYLSGQERTDLLVSESLVAAESARLTAAAALAAANAAVVAVNAQADAAYQAAIAGVPVVSDAFNYMAYLFAKDATLGAYSSLGWQSAGPVVLYSGWSIYPPYPMGTSSGNRSGVSYSMAGWPVTSNPFTPTQMSRAGATATTGTISGHVMAMVPSLYGFPTYVTGWPQNHYLGNAYADPAYQLWIYHPVNQSVTFLSKSPSAIRAANVAWINANDPSNGGLTPGVGNSAFIDRAEFVEAPPDLAQNYFARQDWTPYKGSISMSPTAPDFPAPGDFISITGPGIPSEWATMKVPVSELSLDLRTGAATIAIGPSPRMDFSSLVDRLRIPPEDNYQPG